MKFSKIPSSKLYVIILIIAVGILLFTAAIVYKQTTGMQKSSELVSHSLEVQKEINNLFASYTLLVATQFDVLLKEDSKLRDNVFTYQNEGNESMARLKELTKNNAIQQKHLEEMDGLNAQLYNRVVSSTLETKSSTDSILKANVQYIITIDLLENILQLKEKMMLEEENKLTQRIEDYTSRISLTPVASIVSFLFSLLIFLFAFQKINSSRKKITNTQMFLEKILKSTDNVVVYYEPIRNQNEKIIDFKIIYSNDVITDATGDKAKEIIGKKVSEVYPILLQNGVSDVMIKSIETNTIQQIEKEYTEFFGTSQTFLSKASKLDDGVLLISVEKTNEVLAERKLKTLNKNLTVQNTILSDAERLAKIGSYQWDLATLESTISDNYFRILGYEPGELELTPENLRKLIHPADLKIYDKHYEEVIESGIIKDATYRIITKDKNVKHLSTTGNIQNNIVIGLVKDVTSELRSEQRLRDRNRELKRSNEELESFNRVASHDLQEPLRKIQMFISRLSSTELNNLSDKGRGYIEKVNSSANRMQTLVKYLLSYSRINKTKDDFVKVSLDEVLEKVKEDLEDRIKETGVHIIIDNMPTLKAVPFQMEQLFNNLISNAIKYGKSEGETKIIIDCKSVTSKEIGSDFITKSKKYYRISIMDNGIGFDQENAEKIFELFQRLHQKHEYSGTGIGLAICKKIAENHNGHIIAESTPGEGSTFCVYLPI